MRTKIPRAAPASADCPAAFNDPARFHHVRALGRASYRRLATALRPDLAAAAYRELRDRIAYEREDILGMTRMWRARVDRRGRLAVQRGPQPVAILEICAGLRHPWFEAFVSRLAGEELRYLEPPKVYRLLRGDRIMIHEDDHDPDYRLGVIFHFCKGWVSSLGGNFVIGRVTKRVPVPTPPGFPIPILRRALAPGAARLAPRFNSLLVIRIGNNLGHGVTPVRVGRARFGIVCLFGKARPGARRPPLRFKYALPAELPGTADGRRRRRS